MNPKNAGERNQPPKHGHPGAGGNNTKKIIYFFHFEYNNSQEKEEEEENLLTDFHLNNENSHEAERGKKLK